MVYRVYFFGGRPVVAAPNTPRRLRRAALRHYPAETRRRWFFKQGLQAAAALGVDGLLSKRVNALPFPKRFDLIGWIEEVGQRLGRTGLHASVVWPPPARSTTRVYVHLLDSGGNRVAFAKISFDAENDDRLQNEIDALAKLSAVKHPGFAAPAVLACGEHDQHRYLVTQSLPPNVRQPSWSWELIKQSVVDHYAGAVRMLGSSEVEGLDWWKRFRATTESRAVFVQELIGLGIDEVQVCQAHGDLTPHNLVCAGDEIWLFDWEEWNESAPRLTDEIRFYLAVHQSGVLSDPGRGAIDFARDFQLDSMPKRRDVMMALAFLHAAKISPASKIVEHWERIAHLSQQHRFPPHSLPR